MYNYYDRQSQDGSVNMGSVSDITESQSAFEMRPWPAHYSSQASITPSYKSFMSAYTPSQASFFVLPVTSEVPDQLRKPEDNWGFAFCSLLINPIFGVVAILLAGRIFSQSSLHVSCVRMLRPSSGFWGTGERAFISEEQRPSFEGNPGTKTILGDREHKKKNWGGGEQGNKPIYFRGTGNRYPPGRACMNFALSR